MNKEYEIIFYTGNSSDGIYHIYNTLEEYEIIFYTGNSSDGIYHIYNTLEETKCTRNNYFYTEQSRFRFTKIGVESPRL